LPFQNISATEENEPFTNGIHDDILTHLFKIGDLKVISRASVMEYKEATKNIRQIAEELGVVTVLEGGVQRAGTSVRINVQLIDARTDEHIWAEIYDRNLTIENVFSIQSDIAERVAAALKAELSPGEEARIQAQPTDNLEAYDYYARGDGHYNRGYSEDNLRIAAEMYERAVELDPYFALAYARLSRTYSALYFFHSGFSEGHRAAAKAAADQALRLAPDLAEAHLALGYFHYWGSYNTASLDYERALEEFAIARELQPNNSALIQAVAAVQRRQGRWQEALASFKEALALDPRSPITTAEVGLTHGLLRDYAEAEPYFERTIALAPGWAMPYVWKAVLQLSRNGQIDSARRTTRRSTGKVPLGELLSNFSDAFYSRALFRALHEEYRDVLRELSLSAFGADTTAYYLTKADFFAIEGEPRLERAYYDSARAVLESRVRKWPDASGAHSNLGLAYAGLGRKQEAIREGELGVRLLPLSRDAFYGSDPVTDLARIYVMVGEYDAAIDELELLLGIPGYLSGPWLTIDSAWAPLRDHPRFQRLLENEDDGT
jgi:serine/threonine-protein kinase